MNQAAREFALRIAAAAWERKAQDLKILEVGELVFYAEHFVICSARSARQASGIAEFILETLKGEGHQPLGIEGLQNGQWILLDFGSVLVHIFYAPVRTFYGLEELWRDAPRLELQEPEWVRQAASAGYDFDLPS